ncbi:MAG: thiamine pyrophosphate-binding protein [Dehalococcoidia bacterium]|nr:thiamine pyrophosphate-binding protein [Dehalococcoidia bacterium]MDP6226908.1 thiamine pyrophosphate-binding protein [Dehalococcoidia bacterium]MDP7082817.1 thiamine pyrophosphate-binding protein [Dehalococcoidia bacterium]MDP7200189.1 thiamine pyrophosphate-binding protein [Dehalococcoidia bacterium]MDP7509723.1 thiamine pyrophosphate-binding protein [Dehalococcoidia bacterium]
MAEKLKAGEAVIELLRREGVSHIFGIVGSSFLDILDPLYDRDDIQFIGVRHEQGAALMADGYSRVTGAPSVCLVTNGPGVLNLSFGVASAYVAHSPMVILAPSSSREHQYRDSTQEFDQVALFKPITKAAFPVNKIERLPEAIRHAFRVATSGKMGPVLLDIPRDLMPGADLEIDMLPPDTYRSGQTRARGDRNLIEKATNLLLSAKRPVILAGGGVVWSAAAAEVTRMAELVGAPIVTSYGRADAVPNDHPHYLGHLGRLGAVEGIEAARQADVILAVGTRLGQSTTFYDNRYIPADAQIIQIEIDPQEIGRNYPVAVGIEGDAKAVMQGLLEVAQQGEPRPNPAWVSEIGDWFARRKQRLDDEGKLNSTPMKQQRAYAEIRKVLPRNTIVALDAGLSPNMGQDRLNYYEPRSLLTSLDLGGLGFSFPASLGAKFGAPDRPVVNFNGDGGFMFNAQEFETAVRYGLRVVTVVMNNGCWGSEKAYQRYAFNERYVGADTSNPRFDKFAELFGGAGFYVERPEDIGDAFLEALKADGPSIIEIPVDPDELPRPARLADVQAPKDR